MLSYSQKKALLLPYIRLQRWRYRKLDALGRAILEEHYYKPAIFRFCTDNAAHDLLHRFELNENSVVLDIGGYNGDWAAQIAENYRATIHIFEPMPGAVKRLHSRFANDDKIQINPYALSAKNAHLSLAIKGPGSTIVPGLDAAQGRVSVEVRDAVEALEKFDRVDLLKINIEGAEFDVIPRLLEADFIPRCDRLLIQFHEWWPGAAKARKALRAKLAKSHDCQWNYPFIWEYWQRSE